MAIKKIEMRPEGTNDYADVLYPKTSVDMIVDLERYGIASGTNAYSVTIANTPALTNPLRVTVKFTNANTVGTGCSLNVNGLGAKNIVGANRANIPVGTLKAGGIYSLLYDGTSFQLLGEGGEYGTAQAGDVITGKTIGTLNGIIAGTMPNRGALNQTITTNNGQINISAGYYSGGVVKAIFANLVAGNIKEGVNIGGVTGNYKSILTSKYVGVLSSYNGTNETVLTGCKDDFIVAEKNASGSRDTVKITRGGGSVVVYSVSENVLSITFSNDGTVVATAFNYGGYENRVTTTTLYYTSI